MTQKTINKNRYIVLLGACMMLLLTAGRLRAQCNWDVVAVPEPSLCAGSGKITVSLSGPDAAGVTNLRYSLESITGGYNIGDNPSNVFENVPPGQYRVIVGGVCNDASVSDFTTTTVTGNYVPFKASATPQRSTLYNCNTGQIFITLSAGRLPYKIKIDNAPTAYNGRDTFTVNNSFAIDGLWKGDYTITITDACGANPSTQTVTIAELPQTITGNDVYLQRFPVGASCDKIGVSPPGFYSGGPFEKYSIYGTPLTYSVSYDGGPLLPYKQMNYDQPDTITLPAGQTHKDSYGKTLTYYIKTPCGQVSVIPTTIYNRPNVGYSATTHCDINFDAVFRVNYVAQTCYPVYTSIKNNATGDYWYDTIPTPAASNNRTISGLPYGEYTFISRSADGFELTRDENWEVNAPDLSAPYTLLKSHYSGHVGNDGGVTFTLITASGANLVAGTSITLISPSEYNFSEVVPASHSSSVIGLFPEGKNFGPGSYLFRVTDQCGTYDLPITVVESDVYRYTWDFQQQQTCAGLRITPSGTCMYNNQSWPVYFKIMKADPGQGYDNTIVPEGGSLLLPAPGNYTIGISASATGIYDYSYLQSTANLKNITYTYQPPVIDVNRSIGWVCPSQPDNLGSIAAFATGGSTAATGAYEFKLAMPGNGREGPYLDSNATGKFSTATSGGRYTLMANQNYDIKVVDECGAAAVQTIKIIDLATAQVASTDRAQYCLGDEVHFKVINLPTTAIEYVWTAPDGKVFSTEPTPTIEDVTAAAEGTYHVKITADICQDPIEDDVVLDIAPYVITCYSAVTDTSVNPYAYGLLGAWRPSRTYTYYAARQQSDPAQPTNIRKDGAFNEFMAFWKKETDGWKAQTSDANWVWNAQTTIFNKKGFELENKDPLGRYNAGIYGYDNAVPVAVIQNSRYSEAAFDGFEDYGFVSSSCDDGTCPVDRRFILYGVPGRIVDTEKHTGRYSLRVTPADGDSIAIRIPITATAPDPGAPVFNKVNNSCPPNEPVLKSVLANKDVLLPPLSLLSNKKVLLSAWVKEEQDCKCTSYTGNTIILAVRGSNGNTVAVNAKPTGAIIDGWQRYEQVVDLPAGSDTMSIFLKATGTATVYFDDIRLHPYNANMKSFVYDATNLRLMAELDENNYATFYEYDDDGTLTRVKKETERGIKTIKETRSALIKEIVTEDPNIDTY